MPSSAADQLIALSERVIACERCPRLREHCRQVAIEKRRAYRGWEYWGRPVPSFGDPEARLLIVGLAPGAHGANRTGRMFTGDSSGDFLYSALHAAGFASQPESTHRGDGLRLIDCYITASGHCAPPDNKPLPEELRNCRPYLDEELRLMKPRLRAIVALGRIAFDTCLAAHGIARSRHQFAHDRAHKLGGGLPVLISSYHPSQQNTSTGRLTQAMLRSVFRRARRAIATASSAPDALSIAPAED